MSGVAEFMADLPSPVGGCRGVRPEWCCEDRCTLWVRIRNLKLVNLAKHRRTPMSPSQIDSPTSHLGGVSQGRKTQSRFSRHRTWSVTAADCLQPRGDGNLVAATTAISDDGSLYGTVIPPSKWNLVKQVRTPPVRPADRVVGCVYESFVPGVVVVLGLRAKIKSPEHTPAL